MPSLLPFAARLGLRPPHSALQSSVSRQRDISPGGALSSKSSLHSSLTIWPLVSFEMARLKPFEPSGFSR